MAQNWFFVCVVVMLWMYERGAFAQEYATTTVITNVTASISNETADYFYLQDSTWNKWIACPASKGCFIHCASGESCRNATISTSSESPSWLHLQCDVDGACERMTVSVANTPDFSLDCVSSYACENATVSVSNAFSTNIRCGYRACTELDLVVASVEDFSIECMSWYACRSSTISVSDAESAIFNVGDGYNAFSDSQIDVNAVDSVTIISAGTDFGLWGTRILSSSESPPTELHLICSNQWSCARLSIETAPTQSANVICSYSGACREADFLFATTSTVNLFCNSDLDIGDDPNSYSVCAGLTLDVSNSTNVNLFVDGSFAFYDGIIYASNTENLAISLGASYAISNSTVYAQNANQVYIDCVAPHSCDSLSVFPPYHREYAFTLLCSPFDASCTNVTITVPSDSATAVVDNYMQLDCPRSNQLGSCDNIAWVCSAESSNSVTSITFNLEEGRYVCSSDECCPWADLGIAQQSEIERRPLMNAVVPTYMSSEDEYYIFFNDGVSFKAVNCMNSTACFIHCTQPYSCQYMLVYAAQTSYLEIVCGAENACQYMHVVQGPIGGEARVECAADGACLSATLRLQDTDTVTVDCGSCHHLTLDASNADTLSLTCNDAFDCQFANVYAESVTTLAQLVSIGSNALYNANVYAANALELNVTCLSDACSFVDIYPPYSTPYDFALNCVGEDACSYVEVYVPNRSVAVDNFMQLICPTESAADCDVGFRCQTDLSETDTTYDADVGMVWCASTTCCPWTEIDSRQAPRNEISTTAILSTTTELSTTTQSSATTTEAVATTTEAVATTESPATTKTATLDATLSETGVPVSELISTTSVSRAAHSYDNGFLVLYTIVASFNLYLSF